MEWTRTPQPIEVLVLCLRAVREKLPRGLYSLSVSLQTQLGGRMLRWSRLQEQQWAGSTEPVEHQGRYCDTELNINQSLYMVRKPQQTALLRHPQNCRLFNPNNKKADVHGTDLMFVDVSGCMLTLKSTAIKPHHLYVRNCAIFYNYQSWALLRGAVCHLTYNTEGICHVFGSNNESTPPAPPPKFTKLKKK